MAPVSGGGARHVLRPVVGLGLERGRRLAFGALAAPLLLAGRPFGKALVGHLAVLGHVLLVGQLGGQLEPDAVRVEEIDALEDVVVGHAEHLDAVRLQAGLGVFQFLDRIDAEGDVVDPGGRVGGGLGFHIVAQVEEGDEGAVPQTEEEVRVGAVFASAGHVVALDDVVERQAEDVFVEMPRFFRVACAVGVVVQLLHGGGRGQGGQVGAGQCAHGCLLGMDGAIVLSVIGFI